MTRLVFGCGYLGRRVARRWRARGDRVVAVTRSPERAAELAGEGIEPHVADLLHPESLASLPHAETVLFAVGYDRSSGRPIQEVYVEGLRHAIAALPVLPEKLIYISSTGVYGQIDGERVDESSPCRPTRAGGEAALAAEALLAQGAIAERAIILRLAGIYGPGRIPRSEEIRTGRPIAAPHDGYLNLIHVDDAATIVEIAADRLDPPQTLVVSDGAPVVRSEYYAELARLLKAPPPTFTPADAASPAAQRAGSDKRVDPTRLYTTLPVKLRFPSYREGLEAIVREMDTPPDATPAAP